MAHASVFAALADPTRRAIFERLCAGPASVGQIAEGLPVSRPAVSQHLKALQDAGLAEARRDGTRRIYAARPAALAPLAVWLERAWTAARSSQASPPAA